MHDYKSPGGFRSSFALLCEGLIDVPMVVMQTFHLPVQSYIRTF